MTRSIKKAGVPEAGCIVIAYDASGKVLWRKSAKSAKTYSISIRTYRVTDTYSGISETLYNLIV